MAVKKLYLDKKVLIANKPQGGGQSNSGVPGISLLNLENYVDLKAYVISIVSEDATAQTAALTDITFTAPGTPDYAIQDLVDSGGFGFVTKDEGNTVLSVIKNLQDRVAELETRLETLGILS